MESRYKCDPQLQVEPAFYSDGVPVFEPTMAQFTDFYQYNKAINKYGMQSGIVKIIPPPEWTELLRGTYTPKNLARIRIKNPIIQNMNVTPGHQGVYSLQNVERQRLYDIYQWKSISQKPNYVPPAHKKTRRGLPSAENKLPQKEGYSLRSKSSLKPAANFLQGDFNIDTSEFTNERCEELEQLYWRSLGYAEPMYGADMLGSLFLESTKAWNVAHLPNVLDLMEEKIPGVNDAYLYAGLWKASFSWHLEDQDLYSINYLHFGAPKQWYSIPQREHKKFYTLMKEIFAEDYKQCHEFLRHKTFLASPQFLAKHGITCNKIVHKQGEFMITYPYGYHAGFNFGFNLAESVNFALDDWFPFAEKTQKCECITDAVAINHRMLFCRFKGIPYDSEVYKPLKQLSHSPSEVPTKKIPGRKRQKVEAVTHQCLLCPNDLDIELTKFKPFELLQTDMFDYATKKPLEVHRLCAEMFPDQLVFEKVFLDNLWRDVVKGFSNISRPQRNLKCLVCHTRNKILQSVKSPSQGACFQCTSPKCTRSFHGTCALAGGFDFNKKVCKQHRSIPDPTSHYSMEALFIDSNSMVQFTIPTGSKRQINNTFCGLATRNNRSESTLEVLVYPQLSDSIEVHYKSLILPVGYETDSNPFLNMELVTKYRSFNRQYSASEIQAHLPPSLFHASLLNYAIEKGPATFSPESTSRIIFVNEFSNRAIQHSTEPSKFHFVSESFNEI